MAESTLSKTTDEPDYDDLEVQLENIPEEKLRAKWGNKIEFLLCCIGFAVGLGNVWRFPWLAQQNGGGAFLIPYFTMLFIEGIPLFYLELSLGQWYRLGPIPAWKKISPWSIGVGYGMCVTAFITTFYNVVVAWCVYYLFVSFTTSLPYLKCPQPFHDASVNETVFSETLKCERIGSTQYYWYYTALEIGEDINDQSGFNWKLTLCLLFVWVLVVICVWRGINTTGKVVYFTALFPYVVLTIFMIQGFLLEGFADGLKFFFTPKWDRLLDPKVWMQAAAQIFFSLGAASGCLIAYASYNERKNDTLKDAVVISLTNCGTSIFAGIAIFSILGYRANKKSQFCRLKHNLQLNETQENCTVEYFLNQGSGGTGLAFVAFTEAIYHLPAPTFFAIIFFLMLVTLGVGSMFGAIEGLVTSMKDMKRFKNIRREILSISVGVGGFLLGLPFTQHSGEYILQLFNTFGVDIPVLIAGFFEIVFTAWVYGMDRFSNDIKSMTGRAPPLIFVLLWKYISPTAIFIMLVYSCYNMITGDLRYEVWDKNKAETRIESYPVWGICAGLIVFFISFVFAPGGILLNCFRKSRNLKKQKEKSSTMKLTASVDMSFSTTRL